MQLDKILNTSAFLFGLLLCFHTQSTNLLLIIFAIVSIFYGFYTKSNKFSYYQFYKGEVLKNLSFIKFSTILLILPLIFSPFIFTDFTAQIEVIFKRIFYLLIPLIIILLPNFIVKKVKKSASIGIVVGATLSSFFLIFINLKKYYSTRPLFSVDKDLFNYYHTNLNYTDILKFHPNYYGILVLFAILIILFYINKKKWIYILLIPLVVSIVFINSRLIFIFLFFLMFVYFYKRLQVLFKYKIYAVSSLLIVFSLIIFSLNIILKDTYLHHRFSRAIKWEFTKNIDQHYYSNLKADSRISRWEVAVNAIKLKTLFGYGAANEKKVLEEHFTDRGMIHSVKENYDAHNQFLGFFLESGILGFALLLLFFMVNIYNLLNTGNSFSAILVLFIFISCIFENYLVRNAGINFTAFMLNLFLYKNCSSRNECQ